MGRGVSILLSLRVSTTAHVAATQNKTPHSFLPWNLIVRIYPLSLSTPPDPRAPSSHLAHLPSGRSSMVILPSGPNASQPGNGSPSPRSPTSVMQWDGRRGVQPRCHHPAKSTFGGARAPCDGWWCRLDALMPEGCQKVNFRPAGKRPAGHKPLPQAIAVGPSCIFG